MNIGFDLDGVLYNWHNACYNELVIYWNLEQDFETFWSGGYKTFKNEMFWENLIRLRHLYSNQVPNENLVELLNYLADRHTIYYITNRPMEVREETRNWLQKYNFPSVNNLIFTADKALTCEGFAIDLFVEDRVENIKKLLNANVETVIVEQPYNRGFVKELNGKCLVAHHPADLERVFYEEIFRRDY